MSLKIESLTKLYGNQIAVDNVSFTIKNGEIVGFLGPNGSGKSTTMKCICGILSRDKGSIEVCGLNLDKDLLAVKKAIGFLPENNPLPPEFYVREYLEHIDGFYNKSMSRTQRVNEVIDLTGLSREKHKKIGQLSKGYRQRVGLAQAIISNPKVLILDEPTTGLDPNQIIEIRNLISNLAMEKTVLLSTHILQEVEAICDKIIVINEGKIVADGTASSIMKGSKTNKQTIFLEFGQKVDKKILTGIKPIIKVEQINEREFLCEGQSDKDLREELFRFASENKLPLLTIQKKEETLEEAFRELTQKK